LTFANLTAGVVSWSLNWKAETYDVTDFADGANDERKKIVGLKDWTATVEAKFDSANTATIGAEGQLTLDVDGTLDYSGSAIIANITTNTPVSGEVTQTYSFEGNGTLSYG
jgi:predicted secreted protein